MTGYDAWKTSGRYREEALRVVCPECEETTVVTATTEYGTTEWDKGRCGNCGTEFTGEEESYPDEPPEPDRDDYEEYGRFEPWV